eukprot:8097-Heterococcus_DN1.PRE.2
MAESGAAHQHCERRKLLAIIKTLRPVSSASIVHHGQVLSDGDGPGWRGQVNLLQSCARLGGTQQTHHPCGRHRLAVVVNLDPAAEAFEYEVAFDVRDLITLSDVMEELELGPNGGLVYCMEYLLDNVDWLKDELDNYDDDEYIIFDCPGQTTLQFVSILSILLQSAQRFRATSAALAAMQAQHALLMPLASRTFTCLCSHIPVMKRLLEHFKYWGYTVCGVYALDATFMGDPAKFISGTLLSLSAMLNVPVLPKLRNSTFR